MEDQKLINYNKKAIKKYRIKIFIQIRVYIIIIPPMGTLNQKFKIKVGFFNRIRNRQL